MNTNWAKILLFSLIGFALGFLVCKFAFNGNHHCNGHGACASAASCCNGGYDNENCCKHGHARVCGEKEGNGEDHSERPGDAAAEKIVSDLEKVDFKGDTTITIDGGKVHVVRSAENIRVDVEMKDHQTMKKEIEIEKTH